MNLLITGGCGHIGSYLAENIYKIKKIKKTFIIDNFKTTQISSLFNTRKKNNLRFYIKDLTKKDTLNQFKKIDYVIHLASMTNAAGSFKVKKEMYKNNIMCMKNIIDYCLKNKSKLIHISTDEVYGDILKGRSNEKYPYKPSSPYAASKASSDHLVSSFVRTYKIPAIVTNCSNNYGPKQHPEKLIPKLIYNMLNNKPLPIYGKGLNSREWIYVKDHCNALLKIFKKGKIGEFYNIGSNKNLSNLEITNALLKVSSKIINLGKKVKIKFVKDRPGHDIRYALNSNKIKKQLKWKPTTSFNKGIKLTFKWYNDNRNYYKSLSKKDIISRLGNK